MRERKDGQRRRTDPLFVRKLFSSPGGKLSMPQPGNNNRLPPAHLFL
jgi:hypothetical protein